MKKNQRNEFNDNLIPEVLKNILNVFMYIVVSWFFCTEHCEAQNDVKVKVTFIANEGFLITSPTKKVLIDALYSFAYSPNVIPSAQLIKKMENAETPFDSVDLICVTHQHEDHFNINNIGKHLQNSPNAKLVCPFAVKNLLKSYSGYNNIKERIIAITPGSGLTIDTLISGIPLTILGLKHCMSNFYSMEHNGYFLNLEGVKVLHMGDSWGTTTELETFQLQNSNIDIAFFEVDNFWEAVNKNPLDGLQRIIQNIAPANIVLMHNNPSYLNGGEDIINAVSNTFPNIYVFKEEVEEKELQNGVLTGINFQ